MHVNIDDRKQKDAVEQAAELIKLHKEIKENICKANEKYKLKADGKHKQREALKVGDLVWVHLRKERFPQLRKNKLMPRAAGPFPITAKYGENAYQVDLPTSYNISNTFNIGDLQLYKEDQELGSILSKEGGVEPYMDHGSSPRPRHDPDSKEKSLVDPSSISLIHPSNSHPCINTPFEHPSNSPEHSSKLQSHPSKAFHQQKTLTDLPFEASSKVQSHSSKSVQRFQNNTDLPLEPSSKTQDQSSKEHQNQKVAPDQWTGEQATLLACFRSNHGLPRHDPGQDGISMHGPSHHGPRTLLTLVIEGGGTSARCPSHQSEHVFYT